MTILIPSGVGLGEFLGEGFGELPGEGLGELLVGVLVSSCRPSTR